MAVATRSKSAKAKSAPKAKAKPRPKEDDTSWQQHLRVNERGKVSGTPYKQSFGNVLLILQHHPLWRGLWAYDEFVGDVVTTRPVRWDTNEPLDPAAEGGEWTEQHTVKLRGWLDRWWGIDSGLANLGQAMRLLADEKKSHGVRDFLNRLKWDKKKRLDGWLVRIAGAEDSPYTRAVGAKLLIGAVARVMRPGCKLDTMVVFEGDQGLKKSSMLEALFYVERGWYSGTPFVMGTKDGYQTLRRKWGLEIPELSHFDRSEMNGIKAFLSTACDNYRQSYGVKNIDFPRQSICIGTTNDREWHKDNTGGRRFQPVYLSGVDIGEKKKRIDLKALTKERDQLWAEAVARYAAAENWWLDDEVAERAAAEIELRRQLDPWEEKVAVWLDTNERTWRERVAKNPSTSVRRRRQTGISTSDVLDFLGVKEEKRTRLDEMRVGTILRVLGWLRRDMKGSTGAAAGDRYKYYPADMPTLVSLVGGGERVEKGPKGGSRRLSIVRGGEKHLQK